jgi:hypothetical protein
MKWFKHDSNAHIDAKLKKVKHKYGITGYGIYWYCIELIALGVDAKNITFTLEEDAETIAIEWGLDQLKVQEIMSFMVELNLFENDLSGRITCLKLAKRLDDTNSKNPEIKKIMIGLSTRKSEQLRVTPSNSENLRTDKIRIRLDKTKENKTVSRFTPPNVDEVKTYCTERNIGIDPQGFIDYYQTNNWMRGKNKIKDWKACMRTWEARNPKQQEVKVNTRKPMRKPGEE